MESLGCMIHLYAQEEAEASLVMTSLEPLPHLVLPSFLFFTPSLHISKIVILFFLSLEHNNINSDKNDNNTFCFSLIMFFKFLQTCKVGLLSSSFY